VFARHAGVDGEIGSIYSFVDGQHLQIR